MDNKIDVSGWVGKDELLNFFYERFGSMNKNDYEVELMRLFLLNGNEQLKDNSVSLKLKTKVTKVKRLRYEVDLRYQKDDDEMKSLFYDLLKSSSFKRDGRFILLSIPNKALREYLNEMLEIKGSFFDKSLSSNIVKMTATDLSLLLSIFENNNELTKEIVDSIEKQDKEIDASLKKRCTDFLKGVSKKIVGDAGSLLLQSVMDIFN